MWPLVYVWSLVPAAIVLVFTGRSLTKGMSGVPCMSVGSSKLSNFLVESNICCQVFIFRLSKIFSYRFALQLSVQKTGKCSNQQSQWRSSELLGYLLIRTEIRYEKGQNTKLSWRGIIHTHLIAGLMCTSFILKRMYFCEKLEESNKTLIRYMLALTLQFLSRFLSGTGSMAGNMA